MSLAKRSFYLKRNHLSLGKAHRQIKRWAFLLLQVNRNEGPNVSTQVEPLKETKAQKAERLKREKNPWECLEEIRGVRAPGAYLGS